VRVTGPDRAFALEEHEPLRPVAVRVLVAEHAQQQVAHGLGAPECEQQLDGPLTDVARAPAAARVLIEPARSEVVDQRIVREPRQDLCERRDGDLRRLSPVTAQVERARHPRPVPLRSFVVVGGVRVALGHARRIA
jgi:hypothetical protein